MRSECFLLVFLIGVGFVRGGCTIPDVQQCYVDESNRVLGNANVNPLPDILFLEWCAQICANMSMSLAGVEDGIECYCGNAVRQDATKAPASDCTMPCAGSSELLCGGDWRINVYAVNCSGTPVPWPPEKPLMVNPCWNSSLPFANMPFCNSTLALPERVRDMISRMTTAEKIGALGTGAYPIPSLGLVGYNWWSEATHGVSAQRNDEKTPYSTNFAFPITTAMSFNRSLWRATGGQIGREARAFANAGNGFSTYWAPVINLARDPRWGRNLETPGEDPFLSGEYATHFVRGFQESPDDPSHIQASACCKHYIANEMDSTTQDGLHHWRDEFDATVTQQDLVDSYMLPFQACVERGRVSGLMCSYNAVNGVPSCANDWLLTTVARGEWGFDGYVTSDCDADDDVYEYHHFTSTPEESVRAVLRAGTDVDCGGFVGKYAQSALDKNVITMDDIDARLEKLFTVRMRLGHFDPPGPLDRISTDDICSDFALGLARDGAAQSAVLVKNEQNTLPLSGSAFTTYAVIGPNAKLAADIAGYYGPRKVCNDNFWTMVDAVAQYASPNNTQYAVGVPSVTSSDESQIPAAVALAKSVDQVVLVVGTDLSVACEGQDATSLLLTDAQSHLIYQVADAAKKPVVVVTLTAVPLDLTALIVNPKIGAVVHVGQPSVTTLGVGDVLFGKKVPAGRLVQTILPAAYADQISIWDFNMRPGPSVWPRPDCTVQPISSCPNGTNPGRTHRFFTGSAVVPFGFGLSYTSFSYKIVQSPVGGKASLEGVRKALRSMHAAGRSFAHADTWAESSSAYIPRAASDDAVMSDDVQYVVNVTNTGSLDADDVVLGFIVPPGAGTNGIPLQELFAFERVHVPAGQTVSVYLYPGLMAFSHVNTVGFRVALAGTYTIRVGVRAASDLLDLDHRMGFAEASLTMS